MIGPCGTRDEHTINKLQQHSKLSLKFRRPALRSFGWCPIQIVTNTGGNQYVTEHTLIRR